MGKKVTAFSTPVYQPNDRPDIGTVVHRFEAEMLTLVNPLEY
jgi:hypothetical protein